MACVDIVHIGVPLFMETITFAFLHTLSPRGLISTERSATSWRSSGEPKLLEGREAVQCFKSATVNFKQAFAVKLRIMH